MDEITYSVEQREALKEADFETGRVPLYSNRGRLSNVAIQGLVQHGLLVRASMNRLVLTDRGRAEAQRLLAAEEPPGF